MKTVKKDKKQFHNEKCIQSSNNKGVVNKLPSFWTERVQKEENREIKFLNQLYRRFLAAGANLIKHFYC